ncbi:Cytidine deaminase [Caulifigura coniformis]|uniref:Cytidine deaminase n=1 Tax=Caulifigura coniformis TaxID=2527983 RepID=A0A517SIM1_9PLAN|nr:cytidine deaminase [Caulifigura coniformis]QDT55981.1 Cytidine deaminase [Caulifigura coniformis]
MLEDPAAPIELINAAAAVRMRAYAPYSKFLVGAAVRADDGSVYAGCNVENSSFGLTICAERNAVAQMAAAGRRRAVEIAITTTGGHAPCGACRQVLSEFSRGLTVWLVDVDSSGKPVSADRTTLEVLLPRQFEFGESE